VDWTWFVPGPTILALLAAAWVAGRGAEPDSYSRWLEAAPPQPATLRERLRAGARTPAFAVPAAAVAVVALAVMWASWQPLRAVDVGNDSLQLLSDGKVAQARDAAERAHRIDPLSIEPLFDLEVIEQQAGRNNAARRALERAVQIQPRNPDPWLNLAEYDLTVRGDRSAALNDLGPALYLDPRSARGVTLFLEASRQSDAGASPVQP
jgi:tetratricopeptide (TPR) repeat protein